MPAMGACRVCSSLNTVNLCTTVNRASRIPEVSHRRCGDCGSVFIGNTVTNDDLALAYATIDEKAYYAEIIKQNRKKFDSAADDLASRVPLTAHILDIGGGSGEFLRALRDKGFVNLALHEIPGSDAPEIEGIEARVFRDFDYSTIPSGEFDVVTMMDVMEHVPSPLSTVQASFRALRPGGVIYIHTPVVTKIDRMMHLFQKLPILNRIGRAWQPSRTSVLHLQNYTSKSLTLLMDRSGFTVELLSERNELSWPLYRYIKVYLLPKNMPFGHLVALALAPLLWPLKTRMNSNKGVLAARRA
ncbi:class I SAM-dependent methyltransferase [Mesorhizobium sp. M1399]|uniref:class I SAM-dependent methyltransferase n=1 Tax=Mesorhizobium sp. M1399 TaxID=2957096 RepID=UPI0033373FEB